MSIDVRWLALRLQQVLAASIVFVLIGINTATFAADTLRVFLCGSPPFVLDKQRGISYELWKALQPFITTPTITVGSGSVPEALSLLQQQQVDIAVGSISITAEREQHFDFSHAFMESTLAIAVPPSHFSLAEFLRSLLQPVIFYALGSFFLMLTAVGFLFWLVERRQNPDIPERFLPGLGQGIWLAIATFTTVGYGDIAPRSVVGKFLAGTWMIVSLMIASSVVAGLASAMTYVQFQQTPITRAEDLRGRKVGSIKGTSGSDFAQRYNARLVTANSLETLLTQLARGDIDAVVYDYPVLQYALKQRPEWSLELIKLPVITERYACALQQQSPYREMINQAILHAMEQGTIATVLNKWGL